MLVVAVAVLVGAGVSGCATGAARGPERGVAVTVTGRVSVKPDLGIATLGAEARAATLADATDEVARRMTAVLARVNWNPLAARVGRLVTWSQQYTSPVPNSPQGLLPSVSATNTGNTSTSKVPLPVTDSERTVIVTLPPLLAVTIPFCPTLAVSGSDDDQVTARLVRMVPLTPLSW